MERKDISYSGLYFLFSKNQLPSDRDSAFWLFQGDDEQIKYNDQQRYFTTLYSNVTFEGAAESHPANQVRNVYK